MTTQEKLEKMLKKTENIINAGKTTETKSIVWNNADKNAPTKKGWYLCKIRDLFSFDKNGDNCEFGKPYYMVVEFDVYWDCDGVPIAWAEIPECKFDVE